MKKLSLVMALALTANMAFAIETTKKETEKGSKAEREQMHEDAVKDAKKTGEAKKTAVKAVEFSEKETTALDTLRAVAKKSGGNEVYETVNGILEAAESKDPRSVEIAVELAELIENPGNIRAEFMDKNQKNKVLAAFDQIITDKKLSREDVIANCKKK